VLKWFRRQQPPATEEQWTLASAEEDGARVLS
jgi:hypothetical protein